MNSTIPPKSPLNTTVNRARSEAGAEDSAPHNAILALSTAAFTLMFAVWLMFGVLGIPIRKEFKLTEVQFGWLTGIAILNGSIWRLLFGLWSDRFGGRMVMTLLVATTAIPSFLVSRASTYGELMGLAFWVGMAGNAFSVGIAWNSAWTEHKHQGFALGVFGAGNVGASVTKILGPGLIALVPTTGFAGGAIPGGWRFIPFLYGVLLLFMAGAIWFGCPAQDRKPGAGRPLKALLRPLGQVRVWRFSLYYTVVFGAYVALSVWLPKYYVDVFQMPLQKAALLTALFIFPASLLRPLGGWLADRWGARRLMYGVFGTMLLALCLLSVPNGHVVLNVPLNRAPSGQLETLHFAMGPAVFTALVFVVGCGMGVGKAAVYKYIPEYFPQDVGAVGGLVGLLGALGGFFMPPLFAYALQLTGVPQTTFILLFILTALSFAWLHWVVWRMMRQEVPRLDVEFEAKTAS